jgi:hypothetical protein
VLTAISLLRKEIRSARTAALGQISEADIARRLAAQEPAQWKLPEDIGVEKWSVSWADEILPVARVAHERLTFTHIRVDPKHRTATGQALEKSGQAGPSYVEWAGKVVRDELHKGGWRLAALLEAVVK